MIKRQYALKTKVISMITLSKNNFQLNAKKMGSGEQGSVYSFPLNTKSGTPKDVAIKIYKKKSLENNELQIETHLQRIRSAFKKITPEEQRIINSTTTRIIDLVKIDNQFRGYAMPLIPAKYLPKKKNMFDNGYKTVERTLSYALNDDKARIELQEPIISAYGRKIILLKLLYVMDILHRNGIIVGDISPNNVLVYVDADDQKKNSIMLLDIDSFRTRTAMFPLNQPHTPNWIPPECSHSYSDINRFFQTEQTDIWKISILILRLYYFGPQRTVISFSEDALDRISQELSPEFSKLVRMGLDENPESRPSMTEMLNALKHC